MSRLDPDHSGIFGNLDSSGGDDPTGPIPRREDDDDPRLSAALQEYLNAVESGVHLNRRDFIAKHPEIADELTKCLDGLAFVQAAAGEIPGAPTPPPRRPDIDPSTAQPLGDFQLIQEIGRGGMGTVYEAVQLSLGRRVAVKVLPMAAALDARHLERFHNEAQAAARLHHTNIVPVYAVGCERSVHFYAMQLIDGNSLADVIRDLRRLAEQSAPRDDSLVNASAVTNLSTLRANSGSAYAQSVAKIGLQAAEALDFAHEAGVVHRDIKPANLLLDQKGKLWITDFGLAQLYAESGQTRSGDFVGTLRYMSPEQASGRAVVLDQRTDIYSLGVTLYELLTLQRAMPGDTHAQLLREVAQLEPRSPRSIDKTIPRELEIIISKCITKDPADRYASAGELADDLRRFLQDEPIHARPPSMLDKSVKWVRRHKALTASTFLVLALATLGFSISTALIAREQVRTQVAYEMEKQKTIEANQERARAERTSRLARQAVEFFSHIASDEMDKPGFSDIRREMLEESLAYYQSFMEDRESTALVGAQLDAAKARVATFLGEYLALDTALRANARVRLLSNDSVRKDLDVTSQQATQVVNLGGDFFGRHSSTDPDMRQLAPEQRRARYTARATEIESSLDKILGTEKSERLRQIHRQVRSPLSFNDPDVIDRLGLSHEQIEKLRAIESQYRNIRMAPGPWREASASFQKLRAESIKNIQANLTPGQLDIWQALVGKPFTGTVQTGGFDDGPGGFHGPGDHGPRGGFDGDHDHGGPPPMPMD